MHKLENVPALKFAAVFAAGIYFSSLFSINIIISFAAVIILSVLSIISLILRVNKSGVLIIIYLLIFSGGIFGYILSTINAENDISNHIPRNTTENIYLSGIVSETPDRNANSMRILIKSCLLERHDSSAQVSGLTLVKIIQSKDIYNADSIPDIREGDLVRLFGKLTHPPSERNPGEFNYREYLKIQGIESYFTVSYFSDVQIISRENLGFVYQKIVYPARRFAVNSIRKHVGGDEGAYLSALVAGDRSRITSGMKEIFINAGVMHILAVSGLNVAYVIIAISLILTLFRLPKIPKLIAAILLLGFYCMFTGSPASIIRASVMGSLILTALVIQRKPVFYNITGFAAIIILLFDAKQLFDPGFVLSFTAVLSMSFFYNRFEELIIRKIYIKRKGLNKLFFGITALFFGTLAAQIGVLPVSVVYFNKISIISLAANLIAVPLANISLAIGFLQIIANIFSDFLASAIGMLNGLVLQFQIKFIELCAGLKFSHIEIYSFNFIHLIAYYLILILLFTSNIKKLPYRIILCFSILITALILNFDTSSELKAYFLYAGNSDCTYIRTPDGSRILVDFGEKNYFKNTTERYVIPFLKRQKAEEIDLLVLSNPLKKNREALRSLLKTIKVRRIVAGAYCRDELERITANEDIDKIPEIVYVKGGDYASGFGNTVLFILDNKNEKGKESLVFQLQYGNVRLLFTGETDSEDEMRIISKYKSLTESDILKAPDNGDDESNSIPFITMVKPKLAIVSSSYNEYVNESAAVTASRYRNAGAEVFFTGNTGAVIIETDGVMFNVENKEKR